MYRETNKQHFFLFDIIISYFLKASKMSVFSGFSAYEFWVGNKSFHCILNVFFLMIKRKHFLKRKKNDFPFNKLQS